MLRFTASRETETSYSKILVLEGFKFRPLPLPISLRRSQFSTVPSTLFFHIIFNKFELFTLFSSILIQYSLVLLLL